MNALIEKVKKLLRLAGNNPSAAEAELAAAKAQELILRHKLDMATADDSEARIYGIYENEPLAHNIGSVGACWRQQLAYVLTRHNTCYAIKVGRDIRLIGTRRNVATVRWLYNNVASQIESITAVACQGRGFVYRNNFRMGIVAGITERLRKMERRVRNEYAGTKALTFVGRERVALAEYVAKQQMMYRLSKMVANERAREAGRQAASRISLVDASGKLLKIGWRE